MKFEHQQHDEADSLVGAERIMSAVEKVVRVLGPLESEERRQVIHASLVVLREGPEGVVGRETSLGLTSEALDGPLLELPARVQSWVRQNNILNDELGRVFDFANGVATVIAPEVIGKNSAERVIKAYVLAGVAGFLSTGEPMFSDKVARDLCVMLGCYDSTNHSKYLKEKGNYFTGSKEHGWKLTAPGLKYAAILLKELSAG